MVLVFVAAAYQLNCVFQPLQFLSQYVLVLDDAFYYLQIARNIALYGWATFDRIHAASGIQLLWGLVLPAVAVVLSRLPQGSTRRLASALALSTFLAVQFWFR